VTAPPTATPRWRGLLATDLDGTLLDAEGNLPPANGAALQRAEAEGIAVAIVTGRRRSTVRRERGKLSGIRYRLAVSSGSLVLAEDNETPEAVRTLSWDAVASLAADARLRQGSLLCITLPPEAEGGAEEAESFIHAPGTRDFLTSHAPWKPETWTRADPEEARRRPLLHVALVLGGREEAEAVAPAAAAHFGDAATVRVVRRPYGEGAMVEAAPSGGKGLAIRHLAPRLGVAAERTAAVGDDMNDVDLLDAAACRFAVAGSVLAERRRDALAVGSPHDGAVAGALDLLLDRLDRA
jgi:hypothetical protein